jgi:hypothetical protein
MKKGISIIFIGFFAFSLFLACGVSNTRVSRENYDKISNGMTTEQVLEIMGKADSVSESDTPGVGKMEMWHYQLGNKAIDIFIFNGTVDSKNWTEI